MKLLQNLPHAMTIPLLSPLNMTILSIYIYIYIHIKYIYIIYIYIYLYIIYIYIFIKPVVGIPLLIGLSTLEPKYSQTTSGGYQNLLQSLRT